MRLTQLITLPTRYILWKVLENQNVANFYIPLQIKYFYIMSWGITCFKYILLFNENLQINSWQTSVNNLIGKARPHFKTHQPNSSYLSEKVGHHFSKQIDVMMHIEISYRMHFVMHITKNMIKIYRLYGKLLKNNNILLLIT